MRNPKTDWPSQKKRRLDRFPPAHFPRYRAWHHSKERFLFRRLFRPLMGLLFLFLAGFGAVSLFSRQMDQRVLTLIIAGIFLLLLPLVLLFSYRTFRRFARPLADVMSAADSVAEGDLSVRVPENAPGEFGRLARSFNRMADELEKTAQRRRQLTADVAHELRTPLHILQGNLEGMLDGVYPLDRCQVQVLLDEVHLLSRLVADLQTLSLAENNALSLDVEIVKVQTLLQQAVQHFLPQAEANGVHLFLEDEVPASLAIKGDFERLSQVLGNLITNAIRFTSAGGEINLSAAQDQGRVIIGVSDTGEGIAEDDLPFIFDRFWRGDRARTRKEGLGSGLGLSIAKHLIECHGGEIEVESISGQGTSFRLIFPDLDVESPEMRRV
jgi:signal transduction histidine kinase